MWSRTGTRLLRFGAPERLQSSRRKAIKASFVISSLPRRSWHWQHGSDQTGRAALLMGFSGPGCRLPCQQHPSSYICRLLSVSERVFWFHPSEARLLVVVWVLEFEATTFKGDWVDLKPLQPLRCFQLNSPALSSDGINIQSYLLHLQKYCVTPRRLRLAAVVIPSRWFLAALLKPCSV